MKPLRCTPANIRPKGCSARLSEAARAAGAVLGSTAFIASLMDLHLGAVMLLGPTMDPKVASELSLRLPHLGLRMAEHSRRALAFAERLQLVRAIPWTLFFCLEVGARLPHWACTC